MDQFLLRDGGCAYSLLAEEKPTSERLSRSGRDAAADSELGVGVASERIGRRASKAKTIGEARIVEVEEWNATKGGMEPYI